MPLSSSNMASSVDGTSFTLTDDRNGEDTSGEVTHDIDSNSVLSKPSKVRKRCVKNNNDDDDDGSVNKYARSNGDADVSSCRTEFTDDASVDEPSLSSILHRLVEENQYGIILRVAILEEVIDRNMRKMVQKPLASPHTNFFLDAPSRKNLLIFLCMAEVSKIIP